MVSVWRWGAAAVAALVFSLPAAAQQTVPAGLIPGVVVGAYTTTTNGSTPGFCAVGHTSSTYERNGNNTVALIDLPNLGYNTGVQSSATAYGFLPLDGQVRLTFTTTNSGTARFKQWNNPDGSAATGSFNNFTTTYSGQYLVSFNLVLPNGCTLPIAAHYEVAP